MEIYDQLGLADVVLAAAERADGLAPGFLDRVFGRIPLGPLGEGVTPYPYLQVLEQSRNEEILYENLQKLGVDVRWETPVTAVTQTEQGVDGQGRQRHRPGPLLRRLRRRQLGGPPHRAGSTSRASPTRTGSTCSTPSRPPAWCENAINVRPGGDDFLLAFPMKGRGNWRLIGLVRDADGDGELTEEDARRRLRAFAVTYDRARWFATYRVHHRVAAAFRDGPFFLAGDAAHVHSPVGGQGMNTGLQDAHNLAFKLADVLHGRRKDALARPLRGRTPPGGEAPGRHHRPALRRDHVAGAAAAARCAGSLVPLLGAGRGAGAAAHPGRRPLLPVRLADPHPLLDDAGGRAARPAADAIRWSAAGCPGRATTSRPLRSLQWQIHAYGGVSARRDSRPGHPGRTSSRRRRPPRCGPVSSTWCGRTASSRPWPPRPRRPAISPR